MFYLGNGNRKHPLKQNLTVNKKISERRCEERLLERQRIDDIEELRK